MKGIWGVCTSLMDSWIPWLCLDPWYTQTRDCWGVFGCVGINVQQQTPAWQPECIALSDFSAWHLTAYCIIYVLYFYYELQHRKKVVLFAFRQKMSFHVVSVCLSRDGDAGNYPVIIYLTSHNHKMSALLINNWGTKGTEKPDGGSAECWPLQVTVPWLG